jgi:type II secretory pathway component GspD/PulD (secretin)
LDALNTTAANTLQHGQVWADGESAAALHTLSQAGGADVLAAPRIMLLPGKEGAINIDDKMRLKATPTLAADGKGLEMELRLESVAGPAPVR